MPVNLAIIGHRRSRLFDQCLRLDSVGAGLQQNPAEDRRKYQPRMLVIAPTRELAMQIKKDADSLGKYTGLKCSVVYGGIDYDKQRKELSDGVDVLITTA